METQDQTTTLKNNWATDKRWQGIERGYTADDVVRLRGSIEIKYTLGEMGARRLWDLLHGDHYVAVTRAFIQERSVQCTDLSECIIIARRLSHPEARLAQW